MSRTLITTYHDITPIKVHQRHGDGPWFWGHAIRMNQVNTYLESIHRSADTYGRPSPWSEALEVELGKATYDALTDEAGIHPVAIIHRRAHRATRTGCKAKVFGPSGPNLRQRDTGCH